MCADVWAIGCRADKLAKKIRTCITANRLSYVTALGGRKSGGGWRACCSAHGDHDPSLEIQDVHGKVLLHCFVGCSQGIVLDALRQRGLW